MNASYYNSQRAQDSKEQIRETQKRKEELYIKMNENEILENLKNLVGPSFIFCGSVGFFYGLYLNAVQSFRGPKTFKLLITSSLNSIGKQSSRFANAGAALSLVYCFTRRFINFMFEDEVKKLSASQRTLAYGFTTGLIFKSTRGILPALLFGTMSGTFFWGLNEIKERYDLRINCI